MPDVGEGAVLAEHDAAVSGGLRRGAVPPFDAPGGLRRGAVPPFDAFPPHTRPEERPARRTLLDQIERLEGELSSLFVSTWPRKGFEFSVPSQGGPRMLLLSELEILRDDLAERVDHARRSLSDRTYVEERHRARIEEMLLDPSKHKWVRITNEDIGEPGCKHWHVRPRWGILGFLMNWWRVRISSGCPLARGADPH